MGSIYVTSTLALAYIALVAERRPKRMSATRQGMGAV